MLDGNFEWLSVDECRDMELLLHYANGRMAIFYTGIFDHRENEEDKKSIIFELVSYYPQRCTSAMTSISSLRR